MKLSNIDFEVEERSEDWNEDGWFENDRAYLQLTLSGYFAQDHPEESYPAYVLNELLDALADFRRTLTSMPDGVKEVVYSHFTLEDVLPERVCRNFVLGLDNHTLYP